MTHTAIVQYHVRSSQPQAFEIDAGGVAGRLVSPELVPHEVPVTDARDAASPVSFERDGIEFVNHPSRVTVASEGSAWRATYGAEVERFLTRRLGARAVHAFDHTVRVDEPSAERRPARNVHGDYNAQGAEERLVALLGATKAEAWSRGHYAFVNVWRPVGDTVRSAPLGFVRPRSVAPRDWVDIALTYPDRTGHILGLVANPAHEWVYRSAMSPDDIVVFRTFDNRGAPPVGHVALDLVGDTGAAIRRSVETRTLVRF